VYGWRAAEEIISRKDAKPQRKALRDIAANVFLFSLAS